MKLVRRVFSRNRIKAARRTLAEDASPRTYAALAKEYAMVGSTRDVRRVCQEGLKAFPGNAELSRMFDRASRLEREERYAELKRELEQAPRPALWREMCELMIESGRLKRAEEVADDWIAAQDDLESRFMLARVRHERFLADRGRAQGLSVAKALDEAIRLGPTDARPWHLKLEFLMKVGAWKEARQVVAQLLQLEPGSPDLEGRFRTLDARADEAPTLERALLEVERTGRLADDETRSGTVAGSTVRPILRRLASEPDVHAALYIRGSTVLIQGPKGATAERTARTVRTILADSRSTARRLGLGSILQVQLEGAFGILSLAPGELDAGAIWSSGALGRRREEVLLGLAGLNADLEEAES